MQQNGANYYKGVLLCSRPNQNASIAKEKQFCSRVNPKQSLGLVPTKKYDTHRIQKRVLPVLSNHKKWLEKFKSSIKEQKQSEQLKNQKEKQKLQKIKQQAALIREKVKNGVFNQENKIQSNKEAKVDKPTWALTANEAEKKQQAEVDQVLNFFQKQEVKDYYGDQQVNKMLLELKNRIQAIKQQGQDWKNKEVNRMKEIQEKKDIQQDKKDDILSRISKNSQGKSVASQKPLKECNSYRQRRIKSNGINQQLLIKKWQVLINKLLRMLQMKYQETILLQSIIAINLLENCFNSRLMINYKNEYFKFIYYTFCMYRQQDCSQPTKQLKYKSVNQRLFGKKSNQKGASQQHPTSQFNQKYRNGGKDGGSLVNNRIDQELNNSRDILDISIDDISNNMEPSFNFSNEQYSISTKRKSVDRYDKLQNFINNAPINQLTDHKPEVLFKDYRVYSNKEQYQNFVKYLKDEKRRSQSQYINMVNNINNSQAKGFKKKNQQNDLFGEPIPKKQKIRPILPSSIKEDKLIEQLGGQRGNMQDALMFIGKDNPLRIKKEKRQTDINNLAPIREEREAIAQKEDLKLSLLMRNCDNLKSHLGELIKEFKQDQQQQQSIQDKLKKIYDECTSKNSRVKQKQNPKNYQIKENIFKKKSKEYMIDKVYDQMNLKIDMIDSIVQKTKVESSRREKIEKKPYIPHQQIGLYKQVVNYSEQSDGLDEISQEMNWRIKKNQQIKPNFNATLPENHQFTYQRNKIQLNHAKRYSQNLKLQQNKLQKTLQFKNKQLVSPINSPFNVVIFSPKFNNNLNKLQTLKNIVPLKKSSDKQNYISQYEVYSNNQISIYASFNKSFQDGAEIMSAKVRYINICKFQIQDIFTMAYGIKSPNLKVSPQKLMFQLLQHHQNCEFEVWMNDQCIQDRGFYLKICYLRSGVKRKINFKIEIPFLQLFLTPQINEKQFVQLWNSTSSQIYIPAKQLQVNEIRWHQNIKSQLPLIHLHEKSQSDYIYGMILQYRNYDSQILIKIKCSKGGKISLRMKATRELDSNVQESILNELDKIVFSEY